MDPLADTSLAHRAGSRADLWLALLAGPGPWLDPDVRPRSSDLVAIGGQVVGLLAVVTLSVLDVVNSGWRSTHPLRALLLLVAFVVLVVVLIGPTLRWAARGRVFEPLARRPRTVAVLRSLVVVGALAAWTLRGPRVPALSSWPFGLAGGCEVALTVWAIGMPARPLAWWRHFFVSGPHVGAVVALVTLLVVQGPAETWRPLVSLYLALVSVITVMALTIGGLDRIRNAVDRELAHRERQTLTEEHRRRAHWLHDEVCTRLGFVQKRIEGGQVAPLEVAVELSQLDHSLRERQLEELLGTGEVQLAEVVQPYLRMAQQQGVLLTDVPGYETASLVLDAETGRLAQRTLSNLVGNAIKAGATELAIRAMPSDRVLIIEVEDDAGGFDPAARQPGRGLDRLSNELGTDSLRFRRSERGTIVRAAIRIDRLSERTTTIDKARNTRRP